MPEQYKQGQLQSPVTGTPGVDKTAGVASQQIAESSDKMRATQANLAVNQLAQSEQSFKHAASEFQTITLHNEQLKKAQQQVLLADKIASAKYASSTLLNDLGNDLKKKYESDPDSAVFEGQAQIDNVISSFVPKNVPEGVQAQYRKALYENKATFLNGLQNWGRDQEKVNSNNRFSATVASSLMQMGQASTTQDYLSKRDDFVNYASKTALTPERQTKTEETLRSASLNFAQGIAINNPSDIENAIGVSKAFLSNEEIGKLREQAAKTIKQKADEAVAQQRTKNEFQENVLAGKLSSSVNGALQLANTSNPNPQDVSLLRKASHEVGSMGATFDAQLSSLEKQIRMQPKNELLITQYASLVKQKKQVETASAHLADKADAAAQNIQRRNEVAANKQLAEAHRQMAQGIATALRQSQADLAQIRAESDYESAKITASGDVQKLAEFSKANLAEATKVAEEVKLAKAAAEKNPSDRLAQDKLKTLSNRLSILSETSKAASSHVETLLNKQAAESKQIAVEKAKLLETAGVPLYTTLLQRAQTPFEIKTEKGKLKLEGVMIGDASKRLDDLNTTITDVSLSGLISKTQLQTLQSTIADRRQKLNAWAQQEGLRTTWDNFLQSDAYNKPISDLEKKGLAIPGTPQYKKTLDLYKAHLEAEHARVFSTYPDPRKAMEFLQANQEQLINFCLEQTLKGKQPGK